MHLRQQMLHRCYSCGHAYMQARRPGHASTHLQYLRATQQLSERVCAAVCLAGSNLDSPDPAGEWPWACAARMLACRGNFPAGVALVVCPHHGVLAAVELHCVDCGVAGVNSPELQSVNGMKDARLVIWMVYVGGLGSLTRCIRLIHDTVAEEESIHDLDSSHTPPLFPSHSPHQ